MSLCPWCSGPMPKKPARGSPRRFCSAACRHAAGTAARRWIWAALESGLITFQTIKRGQQGARAFTDPNQTIG